MPKGVGTKLNWKEPCPQRWWIGVNPGNSHFHQSQPGRQALLASFGVRRREAQAVEEKSGEKNDEPCTSSSSSESDSSEDEKGLLCLYSLEDSDEELCLMADEEKIDLDLSTNAIKKLQSFNCNCFSFSTTFIVLLAIFSSIPLSSSTAFIVLHGLTLSAPVRSHTELRSRRLEEVEDACRKINGMPELSGGYHMVALSQGNMVGRGVIENCRGPPVRSFISVGGPNAGHSSTFPCGKFPWCGLMGRIYGMGVYNDFAQQHMAPAGYIKIPTDMKGYLTRCRFLPFINNEINDAQSELRKKRFTHLTQLVLILPHICSFSFSPPGPLLHQAAMPLCCSEDGVFVLFGWSSGTPAFRGAFGVYVVLRRGLRFFVCAFLSYVLIIVHGGDIPCISSALAL
nr:palmitoyl-protein thioesterase 1-like [Ipomoea batatas]